MARSKHELQKFVDQATEDLRNTFESRYKIFDGTTSLFSFGFKINKGWHAELTAAFLLIRLP